MYVFWALTPLINRRFYFAIPLCMLWLLTAVFREMQYSKWERSNIFSILSILLWIFIELYYRMSNYSTASIGVYAVRICFWFSMIMTIYYMNYKELYHLKRLCCWAIIVTLFNGLDNVRLSFLYPDLVSGEITQLNQSGIDLRNNIAFTSFSIVVTITALILFRLLIKARSLIQQIFYFISISILISVNMAMERGASTLILLLGFILIICHIFFKNFKLSSKIVLYSLFLFIGIGIFIIFKYNSNIIFTLVPNERIARRFLDMLTGNPSSSYMSRVVAMKISLNSFLDSIHNFLIGIGFHTTPVWTREIATKIGIGFHSGIADLLAEYGLLGALLVSNILIRFYKLCKEIAPKKEGHFINIVVILLLIYNTLGSSISVDMGVITFIVLPCYYLLSAGFANQRGKNEE